MKFFLYFNTEGYLGAQGFNANPTQRVYPITNKMIKFAQENNTGLLVEVPEDHMRIFYGFIEGRDGVSVLPFGTKGKNIQHFGNFCLFTEQRQSKKKLKFHKEAIARANKKISGNSTYHDKMIRDLYEAI